MEAIVSPASAHSPHERESRPHLSVIVPVYKAETTLEPLYERLRAALEPLSSDFEIVLVEDCGGDRSWELIVQLGERDPRVVGLQFSRNFGQHYGITAGLDYCRGDWVLVMDCDLQDRPEEIPRLYAKAQEGYDVVLACRFERQDSLMKRFGSWAFFKCLNALSGLRFDSRVGNFRIVSRRVVDNLRAMREHLRFFGGMVDWMGFPTAMIDVAHAERESGKSTYTFRKLFKLASEITIAYSEKPLWISIYLGFLFAAFAFILGSIILARALLFGSPATGWPSLFVSIYFLGGIIIANLGVIGIYLGKTFHETKKRPLYIIKESKNARA